MQDWPRGWTPPDYQVDTDGRVIGATNDRAPHNWGRWGDLDELGTVNLITPEVRRRAAELVTTGEVIGCGIPVGEEMPVHPSRPAVVHTHAITGADHVAGFTTDRESGGFPGADDHVVMPSPSGTHWDGLTHSFGTHTMYNGFWIGDVGADGARKPPTRLLADRMRGRGVLLDLPRRLGTDRLPGGHAITARELDDCARAQGVEIRSGDILLVRTGELGWYYTLDDKTPYWSGEHAGLSITTVDWIHRNELAAIGVDNRTFEVTPFEPGANVTYPLHARLIHDLGLTIGELWWLDDLADACERHERWEFMLSAPPLTVFDASGLPVNPLAFF